ncbi:MAG: hypothetical protein LBD01_05300, partial [Puniceicoccales bacterium]|nr:hypothetical protein [Puniceicoccales bacterium]
IQLTYNYEQLEDGKWKLRKQKRLLWDFKGQRERSEELSRIDESNSMALQKMAFANGKSIANTEIFRKKSEEFSPNKVMLAKDGFEYIKKLQRGFIVSSIQMGDFGIADDFYLNYFFTWDGLLFPQTLERQGKNGISIVSNLKKDTIELILAKKDKQSIAYTFDAGTGILKNRSRLRKGLDGTIRRDRDCDMVKIKQIDGYNIPTEMNLDFDLYNSIEKQIIADRIKARITVDEKSILLNQELKDSDFELKIPVGAQVDDYTKDIFYISDGVNGDPEIHERLEDALEETIRETTQQRK